MWACVGYAWGVRTHSVRIEILRTFLDCAVVFMLSVLQPSFAKMQQTKKQHVFGRESMWILERKRERKKAAFTHHATCEV